MPAVPEVIWPVLIFIVVIGGFLKGFFTPQRRQYWLLCGYRPGPPEAEPGWKDS